jgi:hypothetical protein
LAHEQVVFFGALLYDDEHAESLNGTGSPDGLDSAPAAQEVSPV